MCLPLSMSETINIYKFCFLVEVINRFQLVLRIIKSWFDFIRLYIILSICNQFTDDALARYCRKFIDHDDGSKANKLMKRPRKQKSRVIERLDSLSTLLDLIEKKIEISQAMFSC